MNKLKKKSYLIINKIIPSLVFIGISLFGQFALGDMSDPLAQSIKPQIQALFGPNSTVMFCIYIGELIFGVVAYITSKNPLILLGLPIVVVFTHAASNYILG